MMAQQTSSERAAAPLRPLSLSFPSLCTKKTHRQEIGAADAPLYIVSRPGILSEETECKSELMMGK